MLSLLSAGNFCHLEERGEREIFVAKSCCLIATLMSWIIYLVYLGGDVIQLEFLRLVQEFGVVKFVFGKFYITRCLTKITLQTWNEMRYSNFHDNIHSPNIFRPTCISQRYKRCNTLFLNIYIKKIYNYIDIEVLLGVYRISC